MRGLNDLNREHDDKLKAQSNSFSCSICKEAYSEESNVEEGFICEDCFDELSYKEQLKVYAKRAYNYFSKVGICPCPEEVVEFVCECVEDTSGVEVDDAGFFAIAKRLGITLD